MTATTTTANPTIDRATPSAYSAQPGGSFPAGGDAEVAATLGLSGGARWRKRVFWLLFLGGLGVGGYFLYEHLNQPAPPPVYKTATVTRGDIVKSVGATGTVEPVRTVDVGSEISGRVVSVNADWNDHVTAGQVLVTLDTEPLEAELAQSRAQLEASEASVNQAYATYVEAKKADDRAKQLGGQGLSAASALESSAAARSRAYASLENARAQKKLAEARVTQSQTNLEKAVIKAPIDGVILKRAVEVGNAVASSLQTVVLFQVVEDLKKMRLILAVDEADVAQVSAGMDASFTVDAYPEEKFEAKVEQVRLAPTVEQNVVTYQVVLAVDNARSLLRPGMTATATIISEKLEDVLRVPNTALRFVPPEVAARIQAARESGGRGGSPFPMGGGRGMRQRGPSADEKRAQRDQAQGGGTEAGPGAGARSGRGRGPRVWVMRDGAPVPVRVETGATDGSWTEIKTDELKAGDEILVGVEEAAE